METGDMSANDGPSWNQEIGAQVEGEVGNAEGFLFAVGHGAAGRQVSK